MVILLPLTSWPGQKQNFDHLRTNLVKVLQTPTWIHKAINVKRTNSASAPFCGLREQQSRAASSERLDLLLVLVHAEFSTVLNPTEYRFALI